MTTPTNGRDRDLLAQYRTAQRMADHHERAQRTGSTDQIDHHSDAAAHYRSEINSLAAQLAANGIDVDTVTVCGIALADGSQHDMGITSWCARPDQHTGNHSIHPG